MASTWIAIEIGENARKGFSHREVHQPNLGIPQEGLNGGRLGHANDPDHIDSAIIQRLVSG